MKANALKLAVAAVCCTMMTGSCVQQAQTANSELTTVGNPYLPLWEHIPDGEPYVFEDPDNPGKQRVYIYGSHDNLIDAYCGRDQVVWSASVDSLNNWRYDGVILVVDKNAKGEPFDSAGTADVLYAPDVTMTTDSTGKKTYWLFPNDQTGYRNGLIAKSDRPDGPFEVCNWKDDDANQVTGIYGFDPAVFVDDDGKITINGKQVKKILICRRDRSRDDVYSKARHATGGWYDLRQGRVRHLQLLRGFEHTQDQG